MFDASLRPVIDPPLNWLAGGCVAVGLTANGLTILGFVFGVFCAVFVSMGFFLAALICLLLNRLCELMLLKSNILPGSHHKRMRLC